MPTIKRPNRALIAMFGVISAVVALASPASAEEPYTHQPTCSVSDERPAEGGHFTLHGKGFGRHEHMRDVLHSVPFTLAPAVTDASGNFATTVALPMGFTGVHTISSTGATTGRTATVTITIGGTTTAAAPTSNGLAFTGAAVIGIGSLAVLLLVGGGLMLFASRRRKVIG